ncbi:MAG TPA: hypothetical protein DCY15_00640 [Ruminococcaceae bacterium]|nr:hypothetical protein [Oscillospiraceae bacterium]
MKEMLRVILDMDKQACKRVKQAEAYRGKEIAELGEKKNRITEEENKKALDFALKKSQKQRTEGDAYLEKVNERNRKILDGMELKYKENADKWVNEIVENVTKI